MEYKVKENPSFKRRSFEWSKDIASYDYTIVTIDLEYKRADLLATLIGNAYFDGNEVVRGYIDDELKIGVDWDEGFIFEDFYERLTRRFKRLSIGFNSLDRRLYVCAAGFEDFKIYEFYRIDRLAPMEVFDYLKNDDLELSPSDSDDEIDKRKYKEFNSMSVESRAFELLNDVEFMNLPIVYSKYAWCYLHGYGCEADPSKAFMYYTKASELGDLNAMAKLGKMHLKGVGTNKDYSKALCLLNQAALLGSIEALNLLVDIYQSKSYGYYNQPLALSCMRAGKEKKSEYCMLRLGEAYFYGLGVPKDKDKAKLIWCCMEGQEPEGYKKYAFFKYIRYDRWYMEEDELDELYDIDELEYYANYNCYKEILNELYLYYLKKDNLLAMKYKKMYEKRLEEEKYEIDN